MTPHQAKGVDVSQFKLRQLLYISEMADHVDSGCVAQILRTARTQNAIHGETGVLVFDGERFCQLLEGTERSVRQLLRNLLGDERHQSVRILADRPIHQRQFADFRMGYVDIDDVNVLTVLAGYEAQQALADFCSLVSRSDIAA